MEVDGVAAVITGGASGIGEASVRNLTERGALCVIVDRNAERGSSLAHEVDGTFVQADVTEESDVRAAIEAARTFRTVACTCECSWHRKRGPNA